VLYYLGWVKRVRDNLSEVRKTITGALLIQRLAVGTRAPSEKSSKEGSATIGAWR